MRRQVTYPGGCGSLRTVQTVRVFAELVVVDGILLATQVAEYFTIFIQLRGKPRHEMAGRDSAAVNDRPIPASPFQVCATL